MGQIFFVPLIYICLSFVLAKRSMGTTTRILGVKRYEFNPSRFMGTLIFTLRVKMSLNLNTNIVVSVLVMTMISWGQGAANYNFTV